MAPGSNPLTGSHAHCSPCDAFCLWSNYFASGSNPDSFLILGPAAAEATP